MMQICNRKGCPCKDKQVNNTHICGHKSAVYVLSHYYQELNLQQVHDMLQINKINKRYLNPTEKRALYYLSKHFRKYKKLDKVEIICQFYKCDKKAEYVHTDWDTGVKKNTFICKFHMPESKGIMTVTKISGVY